MKLRKTLYKPLLALLVLLTLTVNANATGNGSYFSGGYYQGNSSPSAGAMFVDAILVRPLGLVATTVGTATYVVSLPFSIAGGNEKAARKNLVQSPAGFTFNRPLGEFD